MTETFISSNSTPRDATETTKEANDIYSILERS
jgi:hypothetical protein